MSIPPVRPGHDPVGAVTGAAERAVPASILTEATRHDLGEPVAAYPSSIISSIVSGLLSLAVTAGMIYLAQALIRYGVEADERAIGVSAVAVGVLCGLAGLAGVLALRNVVRNAGDGLYLFADGLVHRTRRGGHVVYRYRDMGIARDVVRHIDRRTRAEHVTTRFDLRSADGAAMSVSEDRFRAAEIGPRIEALVVAHQVPLYLAHLRAGGTVTFRPYTIDAETLTLERRDPVPWTAVYSVTARAGKVVVSDARGGSSVPLATVTNVLVLLSLCETLRTEARLRDGGLG